MERRLAEQASRALPTAGQLGWPVPRTRIEGDRTCLSRGQGTWPTLRASRQRGPRPRSRGPNGHSREDSLIRPSGVNLASP